MKKEQANRFIESAEDLKQVAHNKKVRCYITLNFGLISRKSITWKPDTGRWHVVNHISGTKQVFKDDKLFDPEITLIGEAIQKRALVLEAE